ncbi:hypothetical protein GCM10020219_090330 [Nonomuraea dietziae]
MAAGGVGVPGPLGARSAGGEGVPAGAGVHVTVTVTGGGAGAVIVETDTEGAGVWVIVTVALTVVVVATVTVAEGAADAVTVVVAEGVAVAVIVRVGQGRTFSETLGLPLVLYDPLPSFVDVLPAPVVTGSEAEAVLQDLPLHTFCFTVKRAAPPYVTATSRYETPFFFTTLAVALYLAVLEVGVGVGEGLVETGNSSLSAVGVSVADEVCVTAKPPTVASAMVQRSAARMMNLMILLLWEISGRGSLFRFVKFGQG